MCKYCFVACHIYVTLALPSLPKQLVSPSALTSGLLFKVHGFRCRRMSFTDFFFFFACASLHFIEAYRKLRIGFSGTSQITRKATDLQLNDWEE